MFFPYTTLFRSEDFDCAQCGEFQSRQGGNDRIILGDHPCQLRGGFNEEHAGEDRFAGKMAAQVIFIAANQVFADALLARDQAHQPIQEAEFRAVGQQLEGFLQRAGHRGHWRSDETTVKSGGTCTSNSPGSIGWLRTVLVKSLRRPEPSESFNSVTAMAKSLVRKAMRIWLMNLRAEALLGWSVISRTALVCVAESRRKRSSIVARSRRSEEHTS